MKRGRARISPLPVAGLTGLWLLLNQTLAPSHIVLGLILSLVLVAFTSRLRPLHARLRRPAAALVLLGVVAWDIVQSNFQVARIVLGWRGRQIRSGFLRIPLDLRDPHGLAALSAIVTATPGTVWAGLSSDGTTLTLHVLDLQDEAALVREVKQRYEQPLMRIFE